MIYFEDYIKQEAEMWIDYRKDNLEDEEDEITAEMLDRIDLGEVARRIADNDYITEFLNNCITDELDKELNKMLEESE